MIKIPVDFTDFLHWFKERTENYWGIDRQISSKDIKCDEWIYGAKWIGLTDDQIDAVENKYAVKFTAEHRAFLRVLHTIDRKEKIEELKVIGDKEETVIEERPYFYNWLTDDAVIEKYLDWPFRTILKDVLGDSNVWLKSWGEKPDSDEDKEALFTKWYKEAPRLLPLRSQTFLVSNPNLEKRPVLSIWGTDVIIGGWSLKAYLISKFAPALGLMEMVYSEEDKLYYPEFKKDVLTIFQEYFQFKLIHHIPYWEEMILYWN